MVHLGQSQNDGILASVRHIYAQVELYKGSTSQETFTPDGRLIEFNIQRIGEGSKFFGFGICQRLEVKILPGVKPTTENHIKIRWSFDQQKTLSRINPIFYVTQTRVDEKTGVISVFAYDSLYKASEMTVADLGLPASYTIQDFIKKVGEKLGEKVSVPASPSIAFPSGANFDGTETVREALDDAAEALQMIYYINPVTGLTFCRMARTSGTNVGKDQYFEFSSGDNKRLQTIASITELGDNVSASSSAIGSTQYLRDNAFLDLRDDVSIILDNAIKTVGGFTMNQYELSWRGNPQLQPGDCMQIEGKDCYVLDDVITYNGGMTEKTRWSYTESPETETNDTSLGSALKSTYAKVDKANKKIDLVVSDVQASKEAVSNLQLTTNEISATVQQTQKNTDDAIDGINSEINTLTNKVNASMTAEDVRLEIQTETAKGTHKVTTNTGFTFNENGLTVQKSTSGLSTTITENGMEVADEGEVMLKADVSGVKAKNLHATTYLIVGNNSRFQDYGGNRTGCFWIS